MPTPAVGTSVPVFLASAGTLTLEQRRLIVEQALLLLEQHYVHLQLKSAMHAVNPLQRLRLLRARLDRQTPTTVEPEWQFHREVAAIFHSVRDLHTNYALPQPFAGTIAHLPFLLERVRDGGLDRYLVTHVRDGFAAPPFGVGARVTHWNGVPIARAVELNGLRFAGSNRAATLARGLESLTIRPLRLHLPPDEDWVVVTYRTPQQPDDAQPHELRVEWRVVDNLPPVGDLDAISTFAANAALDLDADERNRAKKLLFAPTRVVELEGGQTSAELPQPVAVDVDQDVPTTMPGVFRARAVAAAGRTVGLLRIFTFAVDNPVAFRDEFVRLVGLLPQDGLIVDVRGNGGGHIFAAEFTLQTLTPRRIEPEPVQFAATPQNLRLCQRHRDNPTGRLDLGPWLESLERATETGAVYSAALPITPVDGANDIGQQYHGPAVLVTDARCYSATDIFAAGWADHEIGPILGVDDTTGAGGANVWTHGLLSRLFAEPTVDTSAPYQALPNGANMRVSIRRTLRVGRLAGTPVEDYGVRRTDPHDMTPRDVLHGNADLLEEAGKLLAARPQRRLQVSSAAADGALTLSVDSAGMDRIDLVVGGRPMATVDVDDGVPVEVTLPALVPGTQLRVDGYQGGALVASRRLTG